jgi:hypothetical protein
MGLLADLQPPAHLGIFAVAYPPRDGGLYATDGRKDSAEDSASLNGCLEGRTLLTYPICTHIQHTRPCTSPHLILDRMS